MKDFKLHTMYLITAVIIGLTIDTTSNGARIIINLFEGWNEQGTSTETTGISAVHIISLLFIPVFAALTTMFWMTFYKLFKAVKAGEIFDEKISVLTRKMAYLIFAQYGTIILMNIEDPGWFFLYIHVPAIGCGMLIISEIMHIVKETKEESDLTI